MIGNIIGCSLKTCASLAFNSASDLFSSSFNECVQIKSYGYWEAGMLCIAMLVLFFPANIYAALN